MQKINIWHSNCSNFTPFQFTSLCCLLWLFVITARMLQSLQKQAQEILHKPAGSRQHSASNPWLHHTSSELGLAYCFSQPQQPTATLLRFKKLILQNYCQHAWLNGTIIFWFCFFGKNMLPTCRYSFSNLHCNINMLYFVEGHPSTPTQAYPRKRLSCLIVQSFLISLWHCLKEAKLSILWGEWCKMKTLEDFKHWQKDCRMGYLQWEKGKP